jgi:hypothetical protein
MTEKARQGTTEKQIKIALAAKRKADKIGITSDIALAKIIKGIKHGPEEVFGRDNLCSLNRPRQMEKEEEMVK